MEILLFMAIGVFGVLTYRALLRKKEENSVLQSTQWNLNFEVRRLQRLNTRKEDEIQDLLDELYNKSLEVEKLSNAIPVSILKKVNKKLGKDDLIITRESCEETGKKYNKLNHIEIEYSDDELVYENVEAQKCSGEQMGVIGNCPEVR
jgi:hypothetical protein